MEGKRYVRTGGTSGGCRCLKVPLRDRVDRRWIVGVFDDNVLTLCACWRCVAVVLQESYGAVVSGLPSGDYCEEQLTVKDSQFTGCSTASTDGQGGAIAIFNTNTEIENTEILRSKGTGVVFVTDDASGSHKLEVSHHHLVLHRIASHRVALHLNV